MVDTHTAWWGAGIGVSVFFSAFFSLSETALLSVSRTRLRLLADQGSGRAASALDLLQRPRRLLATILIGNTAVNIIASVLSTALAIEYLRSWALGIATGVLTFVLLVVGEIAPKTFANEHSEWVALHVARPIRFFVLLLRPLERSLNFVAALLLHGIGVGRVKRYHFHTEEEIKVLLRIGRERGHIGAHEADLIRAVFEFNDLELADIMRPAPEVSHLRSGQPLSSIPQLVAKSGHSRFPVLDETGQRPIGMVYSKDLLFIAPDQQAGLKVDAILRALPQFPADQHVAAALQTMQKEGSHMAAVVDGRGDIKGIITMEDLLEEIVGEISDEDEVARRKLQRDRAQLVAARAAETPTTAGGPGVRSEEPDGRP